VLRGEGELGIEGLEGVYGLEGVLGFEGENVDQEPNVTGTSSM